MEEQKLFTNTFEKEITWTRSVDVTIPVSNVKIYHRVERVNTLLMENAVLQVQIFLKLFALTPIDEGNRYSLNRSTVFTKEVEISTLIKLNNDITSEDIVSLEHQVIINSYYPRPDSIVVNGNLKIIISHIEHLSLEGSVINFLNKTPIAGATVNIKDYGSGETLASTQTDAKGFYHFNNLAPGVYLLEAFTESHKPEQKVSVVKSKDVVNFVLHK